MLIASSDLETECSSRELDQLSDLDGTGERNDAVIAETISNAQDTVASFITIPTDPTPLLKTVCARLAVIELRRRNELLSGDDKETRTWCENTLMKMNAGKIPTTLSDPEPIEEKRHKKAFRHGAEKMDTSRFRL